MGKMLLEANLEMRAHNLVASLDLRTLPLIPNREMKLLQIPNLELRTRNLDPNLDRKTQLEANRDRKMDLLEVNPLLLTPWMDLEEMNLLLDKWISACE